MIKTNLIFGLLLLTLSTAQGQGGDTIKILVKQWTLQECIDYGVEHSFEMARQSLLNKNDHLNLRDAYLGLLPEASGSSSISYNFGRSIDPVTNTYGTTRNMSNSYSIGAGMGIFSGFTSVNNVRYSNVSRLKGLEESEKLANDIAVRIMQLFYDVAYAEGLISISEEQVANAKLQLRRMERQHELGIKPKSDLFDIQAQLAESEYNLISNYNNRATYIINLKQLMNYTEGEELFLDVNSAVAALPSYSEVKPDEIYQKALEELPQIQAAEYDMRAAKLNMYIRMGQLFPSINLNGSINTGYYDNNDDGFHTQFKNNVGKGFGLSMSIPIFYGLSRHSNISRAKYEFQTAQIRYKEMEQSVYKEIQLALQDLRSVSQEFSMAIKKENFSRMSYTANQKKYEQGLVTIIDLNTSDNNLQKSKNDVLKARLTYAIKKKMVDFYTGIPLQSKVKN